MSLCRAALVTVFAFGCGASTSGRVATGGEYRGEVVSFTSDGKRAWNFDVTGLACNGLDAKGVVCKGAIDPASLKGDAKVTSGGFLVDLGIVVVQGTVDHGRAEGTATLHVDGCCTVTSDWDASLVEPTSPGEGDAVGPGADLPVSGSGGPGPVATGARARADSLVAAFRTRVGAAPITSSDAITRAAQAHADYVALHAAAYGRGDIAGGSHYESAAVSEGFTGTDFGDRMAAAGYSGSPGFEVMAFAGDPDEAIALWIESVYHRVPFVSPDMVDFGYGAATGADVMDFGRGSGDLAAIIVYPVDGQTEVPTAWYGNESPQPPAPPKGYPSGSIVTITVAEGASLSIAAHRLIGPDGNLDHVWLERGSDALLSGTWALYAHAPLAPHTSYRVELEGKEHGKPWSRTWSFVTGN